MCDKHCILVDGISLYFGIKISSSVYTVSHVLVNFIDSTTRGISKK